MKKLVIILFVLFCARIAGAQDAPTINDEIKLGNTYREIGNLEMAKTLMANGLEKSQTSYSKAFAYECMGLLARDEENYSEAMEYYKKSILFYNLAGHSSCAEAIQLLVKKIPVYAGIDIGYKGVKLSIIEAKKNKEGGIQYTILKDTSINTNLGTLKDNYQVVGKSASAVKTLLNVAKSHYIPYEKCFIKISSGAGEAIRAVNKEQDIIKVITDSLGGLPFKISIINAADEARLLMKGVVPEKYHLIGTIIDIGSGNTKGGYYSASNGVYHFDDFSFPYGTSTLRENLDKKGGPYIGNLIANPASAFWNDSLKYTVNTTFNNNPEVKLRNHHFMVGGIVWAVVMCIHPEQSENISVRISPDDVDLFLKKAKEEYSSLVNPDLSAIKDLAERERVVKNLERLKGKTFSQENLIAGATWLKGLMQMYGGKSKNYYFLKEGYVGWITGYILEDIINK